MFHPLPANARTWTRRTRTARAWAGRTRAWARRTWAWVGRPGAWTRRAWTWRAWPGTRSGRTWTDWSSTSAIGRRCPPLPGPARKAGARPARSGRTVRAGPVPARLSLRSRVAAGGKQAEQPRRPAFTADTARPRDTQGRFCVRPGSAWFPGADRKDFRHLRPQPRRGDHQRRIP